VKLRACIKVGTSQKGGFVAQWEGPDHVMNRGFVISDAQTVNGRIRTDAEKKGPPKLIVIFSIDSSSHYRIKGLFWIDEAFEGQELGTT
jgi:hypothetical protein